MVRFGKKIPWASRIASFYPFPAEKKSVNEEVFLTKEQLQFVNPETGLAKPRGAEHEEFAFSSPEKKKLEEAYKVVG